MTLALSHVETPIGRFRLLLEDDVLVGVALPGREDELDARLARRWPGADPGSSRDGGRAGAAVRAYFDGDLEALAGVAVRSGGTPFQEDVWTALRRVPAGRTIAYSDLAERVGRPKAVRAVAAANATNPVSLVVPCHRVVAKDGSLWGYGGGLPMKEWLLRHEGARL